VETLLVLTCSGGGAGSLQILLPVRGVRGIADEWHRPDLAGTLGREGLEVGGREGEGGGLLYDTVKQGVSQKTKV
jgi:hypothetical protein